MKKIYSILLIISFFICPDLFADETVLKNGNVVEGNIMDEKNGKVPLDSVLNGQLVGAALTFDKSEIKNVKKDGF